jgi:AraC family 4-hydroxyphenylacetate 3-monooxygenase operon regulatory protein
VTVPSQRARGIIPDIEIGLVYDPAFRDAPVHYATFGGLADFFGRDMAAHRHDRFYQLHFIETGHLEPRLDDVAYAMDGPLVFLTPPSVPYAFRTDPSAAGHVITVAQQLVWRLFDDDTTLARRHLSEPRCICLGGVEGRHRARELSRLFGLLRREIEGRQQGADAGIEALTRLLPIATFRLLETPPEPNGGRRHELIAIRRFHELVEQHFADHWTLPRYAGEPHMTEARLTDLCNRLGGRSPKRVVLQRLALEARRFLAFSRLSVNEIASAMGFDDTAYFRRFFKRSQGVTASDCRASVANNPGKVQQSFAKIHSRPREACALSGP